jgi:hypothetical protein
MSIRSPHHKMPHEKIEKGVKKDHNLHKAFMDHVGELSPKHSKYHTKHSKKK